MLDDILTCRDFKHSISHSDEIRTIYMIFSKEGKILKMKLSNDLTMEEYAEIVCAVDQYAITDMISNSLLWDNKKQKINKGSYYVLSANGILYNVYVDEFDVVIDVRTKEGNITAESVINYNLINNKYSLHTFENDEKGSTSNVRYYENSGIRMIANKISRDEAYKIINDILINLVGLNIDRLDMDSIKDSILTDMNNSRSHIKALKKF